MGNIHSRSTTNTGVACRQQKRTTTISTPAAELFMHKNEKWENGIVKNGTYYKEYHNEITGEHQCHYWEVGPRPKPNGLPRQDVYRLCASIEEGETENKSPIESPVVFK